MQLDLSAILVVFFVASAFARHFEPRSQFWPEAEQYDKREEWEGDAGKSLGSFYDPQDDEKEEELARELVDHLYREVQEKIQDNKRSLFGQDKREWDGEEEDEDDENEKEEPEKRHYQDIEQVTRRIVNNAQLKKLRELKDDEEAGTEEKKHLQLKKRWDRIDKRYWL